MLFEKREHLLYYMLQGHVHLSKKDYGFFNNLQYIVKNNKRVTSNQNRLYEKLIVKYQRQLKKLNHNLEDLLNLEWDVEIVDSSKEYLEAYVYIDNDEIHIRSPFNTHFVQGFRSADDNTFLWHKDKKEYIAKFDTHSLKLAVNMVNRYFDEVRFCDHINGIIEQLKVYQEGDWNPTLRKVNGNYFISAINHYLNESIKDIPLNDDPKTLLALSKAGVIIDNSVCDDSLKIFSSAYFVDGDLSTFDTISEWLALLNVEHVFTAREIIYNKQISNEIKQTLLKHGISCSPAGSTDHHEGVLLRATTSLPNCDMRNISKVIRLTNSRPVNIK